MAFPQLKPLKDVYLREIVLGVPSRQRLKMAVGFSEQWGNSGDAVGSITARLSKINTAP